MAYTSIIPVHRLDNAIDYIQSKEKTTKRPEAAGSLAEAIGYAMNREKTEKAVFEDFVGCTCETAFVDMVATKKRWHKLDGVQGFHLIQSFAAGEVTPELAHLIGQELADRLLKGQFEAVITTHLNTNHYHNHLVFNSVSMVDGHKYHSNTQSYYKEIRGISDALCRKYGLSVIETVDGHGIHYAQWQAQKEGKPTWRTAIRMDIREAIQMSFTWNQFMGEMEKRGYVWKMDRKYIALRAPGMERFVRLKSLGRNYTEDAIRAWILRPQKKRTRPGERASSDDARRKSLNFKNYSGLQRLYYSYLYEMGVLKAKPSRPPYSVRSDIRRLDQRIAQLEYLQKNNITTREQLTAHCRPLEAEVISLLKERRRLYRSISRERRVDDARRVSGDQNIPSDQSVLAENASCVRNVQGNQNEPDRERIREISRLLKPLRKELRMCRQIEVHSVEMEQRLAAARNQERASINEDKKERGIKADQPERR